MTHRIKVGDLTIGNDLPFTLIAGPCAIESRDHALDVAGKLAEITGALGIPLIYKSSFDKANRTSGQSHRGIGQEKGLSILSDVRNETGLPVLTDVHESHQCADVGACVDVLQIPAFLSRQTDLIVAAAETGKAVHVKKGQFLAPWDMQHVAKKLSDAGCEAIMLGDRGTSFGYNTLVSDFRGLAYMKDTGWPVVFDATHSVQQPGGQGGSSGGQRQFVPLLARAAVSIGVGALFIETHENPEAAPSDGPNMVPLGQMKSLLSDLQAFDALSLQRPLDVKL